MKRSKKTSLNDPGLKCAWCGKPIPIGTRFVEREYTRGFLRTCKGWHDFLASTYLRLVGNIERMHPNGYVFGT